MSPLFSDDLAMQPLIWLCKVQLRAIWFNTVQFGTSYKYVHLKPPHIFRHPS